MTNFETTAQIGDTICAYDFPGNTERFLVGDVIEKGMTKAGFEGYTVEIFSDSGKTTGGSCGDIGYIPFEMSFMEFEDRITVLSDRALNEALFA